MGVGPPGGIVQRSEINLRVSTESCDLFVWIRLDSYALNIIT